MDRRAIPQRRPARAARWGVAGLSALLCLGLLELFFRTVQPAAAYLQMRPVIQQYATRPDPVLQYRQREGFSGRFDTRDFRTTVRINSRGLREREIPYEKRAGTRRILALGDSFAFGWGVEEEQTAVRLLEPLLPGIETVNAGCSGWSTRQEVEFFALEGRKYRPDLVLLFFCQNDPAENEQQYAFREGRLVLAGESQGVGARLDRFLRRNSALYALGGRVLQKLGRGAPTSAPAEQQADEWRTEQALLSRLAEECRAAGAALALVIVPGKGPRGEPIPAPGAERLTAVAGQTGIPILDLQPALHEAYAAEPVSFPRDEHWTPAGHRTAALAIAKFLRTHRLP